jgi:hypothetical protein
VIALVVASVIARLLEAGVGDLVSDSPGLGDELRDHESVRDA